MKYLARGPGIQARVFRVELDRDAPGVEISYWDAVDTMTATANSNDIPVAAIQHLYDALATVLCSTDLVVPAALQTNFTTVGAWLSAHPPTDRYPHGAVLRFRAGERLVSILPAEK